MLILKETLTFVPIFHPRTAEILHLKSQILTLRDARGKVMGSSKIRIHPLGLVNIVRAVQRTSESHFNRLNLLVFSDLSRWSLSEQLSIASADRVTMNGQTVEAVKSDYRHFQSILWGSASVFHIYVTTFTPSCHISKNPVWNVVISNTNDFIR